MNERELLIAEWEFWTACAMNFDSATESTRDCICDEAYMELVWCQRLQRDGGGVYNNVIKRAWRKRPHSFRHLPFWWPQSHKGHQERSKFCWKMAEECEVDLGRLTDGP